MATNAHAEAQGYPQGRRRSTRRRLSRRCWKCILSVIGVVFVIILAGALISAAGSSSGNKAKLTYKVRRGNLAVTVTEEGTLESTENSEIKCKVRGAKIPIIWVVENGAKVEPGDELVRLATLEFEDRHSETTKAYHLARSAAEQSKAHVATAKLAIPQYLEGTYQSKLMTLEKDLAIAKSDLRTAQNMLAHAQMMADRDYISALEVQEQEFDVREAELNMEVTNREIEGLKEHTREIQLETLNGNLKAAESKLEADKEQVKSLAEQVRLAKADLEYCVIRAERSGLVTYPAGKPWEYVPKIEEGAKVYMGQTVLLMPDLSQMQVKVGIRESVVDRIEPNQPVRVRLPDRTLEGEVSTVASVTAPAGWWTGNMVTYDTTIKLPSMHNPMPGMSAEVEIIVARHENALILPVAAVVEAEDGNFCWIKTQDGAKRRSVELGDTDNIFTVVKAGLEEGDEVMLHPFAFEEPQTESLKKEGQTRPLDANLPESEIKPKPQSQSGKKPSRYSNKQKPEPKQVDSQATTK